MIYGIPTLEFAFFIVIILLLLIIGFRQISRFISGIVNKKNIKNSKIVDKLQDQLKIVLDQIYENENKLTQLKESLNSTSDSSVKTILEVSISAIESTLNQLRSRESELRSIPILKKSLDTIE